MGTEDKEARSKSKTADSTYVWFGVVAFVAAFNVLYSTVWLAPSLGTENEGMLSKIGGSKFDGMVLVSMDESPNDNGLTPILVRNNLKKNVTLRLDIEVQDGLVFHDEQGKKPWNTVRSQKKEQNENVRRYLISESLVEPTETANEVAWIKHVSPVVPWTVHIEHSSQKVVKGKRSGYWGGTVTGGSQQPVVAHRHFNTQGSKHTAEHGLFFDIQAKERPVMVTGLRISALTCYQRPTSAPPAHVRIWSSYKGDFGNDRYEEREWYLLGEERRVEVVAQPFLTEIPMQPVYIAARQTLSLAIHSDFPFGVAQRVPTIEGLKEEIKGDHSGSSWLVPKWLSMVFEGPVGVRHSEWFNLIPGLAMGPEPLKAVPGSRARSFVGLVQYRVIGLYDAQDHGLSQLLQHHSSWFQHQMSGKHHKAKEGHGTGAEVNGGDGGERRAGGESRRSEEEHDSQHLPPPVSCLTSD
mmetsp:Transcript_31381/g.73993  ORF Transcript_31381/g.73993 Transcript_31381/m.73993 type:complete len:466 (+) Transcript_31381:65-1462(+)